MDFDYYQIKGKWNAATLNRRAEKLEEAQAAADELEEAGAKGVEIIGVKAGKRETIRGKKNAPKPAKAPKAKKAPATKKKAAKDTKKRSTRKSNRPAVVKMIDKAAENFEKYKVKEEDDVNFGIDPWDEYDIREDEKFTFEFSPEELGYIENALDYAGEDVGFKTDSRGWTYSKHENLLTTISNLKYEQKPATLELDGEEMALITRAIDNLIGIQKSGFYKMPLQALLNSLKI